MMLKKRAAGAVTVATSVVVMTLAAQAAPTDAAVKTTKTELATNGMAGIAASMNRYETDAYEYIEMASAEIVPTDVRMVASGEETGESMSDATVQTEISEGTEAETDAQEIQTEENADWQNNLMADVDEFLYVRDAADENAQIVGKLYKGDLAEIEEAGDKWTQIKSGNVEGYVSNAYCVTGEEALAYATENFDTEAEVLTNGLRIRSDADENASVVTAVAEGTTLTVDSAADADSEWVPVIYGGTTRYVSSDYVTVSLALGEGVTIEEEQAELARIAEEEAAKKSAQITEVTTVQNSAVEATTDDVTLLAAIIQCESGNEIYEGQLAVGAVVMNRVRSGSYPNTVSEVIYQRKQFTPAGSGAVATVVANGPKQSCLQAAQEALNGIDNTGGATSFRRASSGHAGVVIGNHVFY